MSLLKNEKEALKELKEEISKRYRLLWMKLIGSKARGDFDEESDIDIVIVLENADWDIERDIYKTCSYLGLKYDVVILPIIYSEEDINDTFTRITPFYRTVESEGILISKKRSRRSLNIGFKKRKNREKKQRFSLKMERREVH